MTDLFHLSFWTDDLAKTKAFYAALGCMVGRERETWFVNLGLADETGKFVVTDPDGVGLEPRYYADVGRSLERA